MSGEPQKITLA